MKVTFKVQQHLAMFHLREDSGDWTAVCCRRGLEKLLGRRTKAGEVIDADITATEEDTPDRSKP